MSALIPLYRTMASDGANFRGLSILQHSKEITQLMRGHKGRTLLDYGSGAGDAWRKPHRLHERLGIRWFDVTLYDPAFPSHDEKPHGIFDGVLCSDVLEHVPAADVDAVLADLFKHARRFVWASVCCREAKKCFPDGTNLHVTIQPLEWWRDRLTAAQLANPGPTVPFTLVETP